MMYSSPDRWVFVGAASRNNLGNDLVEKFNSLVDHAKAVKAPKHAFICALISEFDVLLAKDFCLIITDQDSDLIFPDGIHLSDVFYPNLLEDHIR